MIDGAMARIRIDELLEQKGMTAYRLAVDSGISHSSLAKLRHNKAQAIRLDVIDRLCEVLECGVGDLIEAGNTLNDTSNKPKKSGKK